MGYEKHKVQAGDELAIISSSESRLCGEHHLLTSLSVSRWAVLWAFFAPL